MSSTVEYASARNSPLPGLPPQTSEERRALASSSSDRTAAAAASDEKKHRLKNYETLRYGVHKILKGMNQQATDGSVEILNNLALGILEAVVSDADRFVVNSNKKGNGSTKDKPQITLRAQDVEAALKSLEVFNNHCSAKAQALAAGMKLFAQANSKRAAASEKSPEKKKGRGDHHPDSSLDTAFVPARIAMLIRRNSSLERIAFPTRYILAGALTYYITETIKFALRSSEEIPAFKDSDRMKPKYIAAGLRALGLSHRFDNLELGYRLVEPKVSWDNTTESSEEAKPKRKKRSRSQSPVKDEPAKKRKRTTKRKTIKKKTKRQGKSALCCC